MSGQSDSAAGLFTPLHLGERVVRNRVVLPPMVVSVSHNVRRQGLPDPATIDRYAAVARGGAGLIVVEATSVLYDGQGWDGMLGLWNDLQAEAFVPIAKTCRREGAVVLVQLNHHGPYVSPALGEPVSASGYESGALRVRGLTRLEIHDVRDAFVSSARRAHRAGFDGVELHACHGYLLNQFLDGSINRRSDEYGGSISGRTRLIREIVAGIRGTCPPDFLISVRMAGTCPTLDEGVRVARSLEASGVNMLSVSFGINRNAVPQPGPDFPFSPLCGLGCQIRRHVSIPVVAVGGLSRPQDAQRLVEEDWADLAAVGRGHLIHPNWVDRVLNGYPISPCLQCAECAWYTRNPERCPAFMKAQPIISRSPVRARGDRGVAAGKADLARR
jgi:2,4-dienoyl-CoA reductase-like NADH-dependent reductase (Old Yellow Enzyme family)